WGGEAEQAADIAAGDPDAVNWKAHARKTAEDAMRSYWPKRLRQKPDGANPPAPVADPDEASGAAQEGDDSSSDDDSYARARKQRLLADQSGGWKGELDRYLADPSLDVDKDADTVLWWSKHVDSFPTLARMALDILPIPASSVASERLFSSAKEVATSRRSRLGSDVFEWIECLAHFWAQDIVDLARINSEAVEEYDSDEYAEYDELDEMLCGDEDEDSD
ncbi:hATC-domain-containing protein, partial [Trametes versicolor FP-101664 SS1]|uniref:hATC-domain-containing protein n=1 Tax=Trametes versicolor (strain FP-101664) TaxID=717944 RepID=UPI0004621803